MHDKLSCVCGAPDDDLELNEHQVSGQLQICCQGCGRAGPWAADERQAEKAWRMFQPATGRLTREALVLHRLLEQLDGLRANGNSDPDVMADALDDVGGMVTDARKDLRKGLGKQVPEQGVELYHRLRREDGLAWASGIIAELDRDLLRMEKQLVRRKEDIGTAWWESCQLSRYQARSRKALLLWMCRTIAAEQNAYAARAAERMHLDMLSLRQQEMKAEQKSQALQAAQLKLEQRKLNKTPATSKRLAVLEGSNAKLVRRVVTLEEELTASKNRRDKAEANLKRVCEEADRLRDSIIKEHNEAGRNGRDEWQLFLIRNGLFNQVSKKNQQKLSERVLEACREKGLLLNE